MIKISPPTFPFKVFILGFYKFQASKDYILFEFGNF